MDIVDDGSCFVCGRNHPFGLKLRFELDPGGMRATTTTALSAHFSGWKRAAHGGIVSAMLDEAMVYACAATGVYVATASMNVKFRKPVPVETELEIVGEITQKKSRTMRACSRIVLHGRTLAEAEGALIVMRPITEGDPEEVRATAIP